MSPRKGFSLLELVVIIFIVSILLVLGTSAVQSAREASRCAQCASNLRAIGLALGNYHAIHNCFPPGHGGNGASPHLALLPWLEEAPLYNAFNHSMNGTFSYPANLTVTASRISVFLCPSDRAGIAAIAGTNYAGNRGSGVQRFGYNGIFAIETLPPVSASSISDGLSSTVAFTEWLRAGGWVRREFRRDTLATSAQRIDPSELEDFAQDCARADYRMAALGAPRYKGELWAFGEFGFSQYNHVLTPNQNSCVNGRAFQEGAWTSGSEHTRGVNTLFADGHIQFVRDSVSLHVWRAIGSRNGLELIEADAL